MVKRPRPHPKPRPKPRPHKAHSIHIDDYEKQRKTIASYYLHINDCCAKCKAKVLVHRAREELR